MIEINLVPDVKIELLKARKMRTTVISFAILASIVSGSVVALLGIYTFGGQEVAKWSLGRTIDDEGKKLTAVEGLPQLLTIQSQLGQLSEKHNSKLISSRLFDLATTIVPGGNNEVAISKIDLDVEAGTITLDAEAKNGYEALEVFKKTLAATNFTYTAADQPAATVPVASDIQDQERNFGENASGNRVLRFTMSFTYAKELFTPNLTSGSIVAPTKQNATDSAKSVPKNLFTDSAPVAVPDEEGAQ